jgi:hypothetical protein
VRSNKFAKKTYKLGCAAINLLKKLNDLAGVRSNLLKKLMSWGLKAGVTEAGKAW